jgi:hypothetical protein
MKSLSSKWRCPNCEKSSARRWNLQRHISRWHGGSGQPFNNDRTLYDGLLLQQQQQHIPPTTSYISNPDLTQKSYKKFDLFVGKKVMKGICD